MKKRIYEFDRNDCRWPLDTNDDGEQLFCSKQAPEGLPYCPAHGRMSLASGNDPRPIAPQGHVEFPRQARDYLDRRTDNQSEHEPDLVEILALAERPRNDGLTDRLRQMILENGGPIGRGMARKLTR